MVFINLGEDVDVGCTLWPMPGEGEHCLQQPPLELGKAADAEFRTWVAGTEAAPEGSLGILVD